MQSDTMPILTANMSTELLGRHGIIFYRTNLLGKPCTCYTVTPFLHRKNNQTSLYLLLPPLRMLNQTKPSYFHVLKFPVKNLPVSRYTRLTKCNMQIIPSKLLLWLLSKFHMLWTIVSIKLPTILVRQNSNQHLPILL